MENKKTAVEETPEIKMTAFEKALLKNCIEMKKINYEMDGKKFTLKIKTHIDMDYRREVIDSVEGVYFRNGVYNKALGDTVMENLIFTLYTDMTFGDDIASFDKFRSGKDYGRILEMMPDEVGELWDQIDDKVEFLKPMYNAPIEQKKMHESFTDILIEGVKLLEHLENAMDSLSGMVEDKEKFKMADLLAAMTKLEAKDEAKIAKAVLDFQEEKAKRVAAVSKETVSE